MLNSSSKRRIELDVMKLLTNDDFKASLINDNLKELCVCLEGPKDTPYEGGLWKIHVELPEQYPYKSPSIGFETKIFHPNIDEQSGSVCLDVINQTWSPMFTITHIFETFIPQLLNYPNAADPLNGDASSLYLNDKQSYDERVKTYVKKYANRKEILRQFNEEMGISDSEEEEEEEGEEHDEDAESEEEAKEIEEIEGDVKSFQSVIISDDKSSLDNSIFSSSSLKRSFNESNCSDFDEEVGSVAEHKLHQLTELCNLQSKEIKQLSEEVKRLKRSKSQTKAAMIGAAGGAAATLTALYQIGSRMNL